MGGGGEILLTSSGGRGQETSDDDTPVLLPPFFPQCHQLHDRLCPVPSYFRPFPPFTQKRRRGPRGVPKATGGWFGADARRRTTAGFPFYLRRSQVGLGLLRDVLVVLVAVVMLVDIFVVLSRQPPTKIFIKTKL